jgi:hypothetical protein
VLAAAGPAEIAADVAVEAIADTAMHATRISILAAFALVEGRRGRRLAETDLITIFLY